MSLLDLIVLLENEDGVCSSCGRHFKLLEEFGEDSLGLKEYSLSRLCKSCQDGVFNYGGD